MRWGLLGAGGISARGARGITDSGGRVVAVAARDHGRARALADEVGAERAYGSYAELLADDDVEAIYVNTTHPWHHEQALAVIAAGKHVVVEKAFTLNTAQAMEIFAAARERGVFAMEGMWTRALPLYRHLERLVADGAIGDVVAVRTCLTLALDYDPTHRLFDRHNGGGTLLDLGVYAATVPWLFLGRPQTVHVMGSLAPSGVDQVVAMQWGYETGATAQLFITSRGLGPDGAVIIGRTGYLEVDPKFHGGATATLVTTDGRHERIELPHQAFAHEFAEAARCIRAGELAVAAGPA